MTSNSGSLRSMQLDAWIGLLSQSDLNRSRSEFTTPPTVIDSSQRVSVSSRSGSDELAAKLPKPRSSEEPLRSAEHDGEGEAGLACFLVLAVHLFRGLGQR